MNGVCTARGNALYVLILGCIARRPMTANEIAAELQMGNCGIYPVLRRLRGVALHVTEYRKSRGCAQAVWAFGLGDEPPAPPCVARQVLPKSRSELATFACLAELLMSQPATVLELHEATGLQRSTLYGILRLAKKQRIAFIAEWDRVRDRGAYSPAWQLGARHADARKPRLLTRREIDQRSWEARKQRQQQMQVLTALAANTPAYHQRA